MKQLSGQGLIDALLETKERPLILKGYQITGVIKKIKISDVHFIDSQFFNITTQGTIFSDCKFQNTKFTHSHFNQTQITNSIIQDSSFFSSDFTETQISTSKVSNIVSIKTIFNQCELQYTKFVCNSLISNQFQSCKMIDVLFEYTTLDASIFEKCEINNSIFKDSNMRGVTISGCHIENSAMDTINFDDCLNINPSEFFIPTSFTKIKGNKTSNFALINSNLKKELRDFAKSTGRPQKKHKPKLPKHKKFFLSFSKIKTILHIVKIPAKKSKEVKIEENVNSHEKPRKHILPHHLSNRNVASFAVFSLQGIITLFTILIFTSFYKEVAEIFYKSIPNEIEFPIFFKISTVEIHSFAFHFSLLYFATSGLLLATSVACVKGIKNLLLPWMYRAQSIITISVLIWLWWNNTELKSLFISTFNLVFLFYYILMFIQSFKTTLSSDEHRA